MVIRGRTRGNGRQLSNYLLTMAENEDIRILDVDGRENVNDNHLHHALLSMSLTSELSSRSDKGLYHAQINPAYGDDVRMDNDSWLKAADMLGNELGLAEQRRIVVLHTKKGRTHAHVVWERYDHEKKKMISDSFSRLAQDRARLAMERVFEQQQTPLRNAKRPEMKQMLSDLWRKLKTGGDFVKAAKHFGYVVAAGVQRRPFMVVDDTGRSFDLVRQLEGVKTKEVREKLKDEKLVAEKDAIALVRKKQQLGEKQKQAAINDNKQPNKTADTKQQAAQAFAESRTDITTDTQKEADQRKQDVAASFAASRQDMTIKKEEESGEKKKETLAVNFAENRNDALTEKEKETQRQRQEFLQSLEDIKQQKKKGKGYEPG